MLPPNRYHNLDYDEDETLSEDIRYRREIEYAKVSPRFKLLTAIAPFVVLSTVFIGFHFLIAVGLAFFALFLLFIIRINRDGDKMEANCSSCDTVMVKEVNANIEYYVCHDCKMFARGRDWG